MDTSPTVLSKPRVFRVTMGTRPAKPRPADERVADFRCTRHSVRFCVKVGKTPAGTHEMSQTIRGGGALSSSASEWFKRFKDGREDLQDDPRSGRPSTSRHNRRCP